MKSIKAFFADLFVTLVLPWRIVQRAQERVGFGFFGRHTFSGVLILPVIIGAFVLVYVASPSHEHEASQLMGDEDLPAPQAGLMAVVADGIIGTPPVSEWLPRVLLIIGGWLISGVIAGFILSCLISGLIVMLILAGGQKESGTDKLFSFWRLSSQSTLLLPIAVIGLIAWTGVYVEHLMGNNGTMAAKIALAIAATCWATGAFWAIAWAIQRKWTNASSLRAAMMAVVFSGACWLVALIGNFLATQPLHWMGFGFTNPDSSISTIMKTNPKI